MALVLAFALLATILLTLFNGANVLFLNQPTDSVYLLPDLIVALFIAFLFWLNRKGYTQVSALLFIITLALYPFVYPLYPVELTLLLYAPAIILASFTLEPSSALLSAAGAILCYQILWIGFERQTHVAIIPATLLVLLGVITWLIADRWERTLLQVQEFQIKYQLLVDEFPGLAYLREPGIDGRWLYCSPQIETMLGIKPDAWIERPEKWLEQIHPDDRDNVLNEWCQCSEHGAPFHIEYRLVVHDDQFIWVREDATMVHVPGQSSRYQGMIINITARKQAEENLRRDVDEMSSLTQMSREITSVADLNRVLALIAYQVTELVHSDAGGVYGISDDGRLRILATYGIGERYVREVNAVGIEPGMGIIGRAVAEHHPVAVSNVFDDPNYQLAYFSKLENIYGVLAAPMLRDDKVSGVIVAWHRKPHDFSDHEIHLLQAIAQQCVNAVENARLLEAEREQRALAEALRDTASAFIGTASPEELLDSILDNLKHVVPYDAANIMLVTGNSVHIARHRGYAELGKLDTIQTSVTEIARLAGPRKMLETLQPYIIPDVHHDPTWRTSPESDWIASYAGVPIRLQDHVIGFINIDSTIPNFFSARQLRPFQAFADQAALAIENARLLSETQQSATEFATLYETTRDMATMQNLSTLLETIAQRAIMLLHSSSGGIYLYDAAKQEVELRVRFGISNTPIGTRLKLGEGMAGRVAQTRQPLAVSNYQTWEFRSHKFDQTPINAVLEVPMLSGGELIGVLAVQMVNNLTRTFSNDDLRLLSLFASQAASAVRNARLLAETQQSATEFAALYETTRDLATMQSVDLITLLETIVQRAIRLLHAEGGGMYLYDAARQELEVKVGTHPSTPVGTRLKLGEGMAGRVAQTRKPIIVDDYRTWEFRSSHFGETPLRAVLEVPMLYSGELIGVLVVEQIENETRKFTNADVQLLSLFASQAASAVHNARLITETQQRAERLGVLNRIARHINELTDLNAILEMIYRELDSTMQADSISIALYDSSAQELDFRILTDGDIRAEPVRRPVTTGLSGWVASRKQPVLVRDYEREKESLPPSIVWGTGALPHTWLGVPMLVNEQLVGIIILQSYDLNFSYTQADQELVSTIADTVALAINKARLFQEQERRASHLEILNDAAIHTQQYLEPGKIFQVASDHIRRFGESSHVFLLDEDNVLRHHHTALSPKTLQEFASVFHNMPSQLSIPLAMVQKEWEQLDAGMTLLVPELMPRIIAQLKNTERQIAQWIYERAPRSVALLAPLRQNNRTIGAFVLIGEELSQSDIPAFALFARQVSVALDNAHLFETLRNHSQRQEALYQISAQIARLNSPTELCDAVTRTLRDTFGFIYTTIFLVDEETGDRVLQSYCGWQSKAGVERLHPGQGVTEKAIKSGVLQYYPDVSQEPMHVLGLINTRSEVDVPLRIGEQTAGVITVEDDRINAFNNEDLDVLQVIANHLGIALEKAHLIHGLEQELAERKRAEEQIQRQVERLASLHSIDAAISSSLDLNVTFEIILDQVTSQLHIDAADILRLNAPLQMLEYAAGRGFHSRAIQHTRLPLGKEHAGRAAYERRMIFIPDLSETQGVLQHSLRQHQESFVAYFAFPLIAKGEVKGVLEIFHRSRLEPDQAWFDFAETLAAQTAIAMDNMALFDRLQKTNSDLILAYDTTLEGWSRALELRDMETQGHSARVTELTLRLARAIGINESELANVRHGALLHDIGKMGIPDSILMKPGPLTEDEWVIMRNHPVYAYQLLSRIPYLRPAIDIPYAHHEHWDGRGYPRGLKGAEIPLPARIFAVIDVWDALRSERPYHKAWNENEIREHILNLSGKQFDPQVVQIFLQMDKETK